MGKNKRTRSTHRVLSGVLLLTAANLTVKLIGLIYKIPLTNMLGDEGMGYFNTAYQIYSWLYMLSTAGLPVAMSLTIAECNAKNAIGDKRRLLKYTLAVFSAIGLVVSIMMAIFCRKLAAFISADLSYLCILAISPSLFFICISSTLRGYFQGHSDMLPTALSEIIEALGKLIVGIFLGSYAVRQGLPIHKVAAYSIFGITVGIVGGAILLMIFKAFGRETRFSETKLISSTQSAPLSERTGKELFGSLIKIAIPIMLSSSLLSMSSMVDTLVVIRRLRDTGISSTAAVAMYGNYTAYCVTLFNLPPVIIYPIVNALIPEISSARATGDEKSANSAIYSAFRNAALISLPCSFGLSAMSGAVLKLIFSNAASTEMAAPLLSVLSPSVFLIGVMAVSNAVLQAYGLQNRTLISMLFGAIVKFIGAYLLTTLKLGNTYVRMYAAPISTFLFYLTVVAFNFYFITSCTELKLEFKRTYIRPCVAAILCATSASLSYRALTVSINERPATILAISIAAIVYFASLFLFGAIKKEDVFFVRGTKSFNYKHNESTNTN